MSKIQRFISGRKRAALPAGRVELGVDVAVVPGLGVVVTFGVGERVALGIGVCVVAAVAVAVAVPAAGVAVATDRCCAR